VVHERERALVLHSITRFGLSVGVIPQMYGALGHWLLFKRVCKSCLKEYVKVIPQMYGALADRWAFGAH